ncbi:MAG TPA: 23S rRNA (adenine(2030)-N(6))-methyltransferase RlmJ [Roseiarcus sp.]|nr:23S rRNA (adenine(2030)-N(6))-methyltransferase RlmJ [Roseiarcus sp.]
MNYRHGFHAGNFADVFKHVLLTRALAYLIKKPAPLRFIDTHAGAGRYDLEDDAGRRSPEWRDGIARLLKAKPPAPIADLLAPYIAAVGGFDPETGRPLSYPGSPAIAQSLLRRDDRIALCEAHPREYERLMSALGRDRRLRISSADGYMSLNAYLPPPERRGLALIDPPYEAPDEAAKAIAALAKALGKWPRGVYLVWRPIKGGLDDARFLNAIRALGAPDVLGLELDVGAVAPGPYSPAPLHRSGLLIVNPPYGLVEEARLLMPYLTKLLTRAGQGEFIVDWVTAPT